jgi:HEPN domain-containing protein
MPSSIKTSLTEADIESVRREYKNSFDFYWNILYLEKEIEIAKLEQPTSDLLSATNDLLIVGIADINMCLAAFLNSFSLEPRPIMFEAQQASEKFLKALLLHLKMLDKACITNINISGTRDILKKNIEDSLKRKYGHKLENILSDLKPNINDPDNFEPIEKKISELLNRVPPDMSIRYKVSDENENAKDAIECIDLMIGICNYVAKRFIDYYSVSQ